MRGGRKRQAGPGNAGRPGERGAAGVEQAGLAALVALLLLAAIAAVEAGGKVDAGRALAGAIARKMRCAPHLPDACAHDPLVSAYGWPLARLARALAPPPAAETGPSGLPLVPVDFRRCRSESCAVAAGPHLTAANRRSTAFTQLLDRRGSLGWVEVDYWLYRPGLGWERVVRRAGQAQIEAASHVRLRQSEGAALVPLETLPGANHYDFPKSEQPPWQWHVEPVYPGWSS
jgi:hypothetical protein